MNKLYIIGNLTKNPESYEREKLSVKFTVAVNRRFKVNGNTVTDFWDVWASGKLAEICKQYLSKGSKVCVIGEAQPKVYEKKDGTKGFSLNVSADEVEFLSSKSEVKADDFQDINSPDLPWEV